MISTGRSRISCKGGGNRTGKGGVIPFPKKKEVYFTESIPPEWEAQYQSEHWFHSHKGR